MSAHHLLHLQMRLKGYHRAYVKRVGQQVFIRRFDQREVTELRIGKINKQDFSEFRAEQAL